MECNKDEAIRAKNIAVKKFTVTKDISGAKKFALKAQLLDPGLEGISQMLTILDVYISAENRVGGEPDYYGILGVLPFAGDEIIKKKYEKLALQLDPDNYKSIGADSAFLFLTEAFNVLSDKAKRSAYNIRRGIRIFQRLPESGHSGQYEEQFLAQGEVSVPQQKTDEKPQKGTTVKTSPPHLVESCKRVGLVATSSVRKLQKGGTQRASGHYKSSLTKSDTFWTRCSGCKFRFEYLQIYLNKKLQCQKCKHSFSAVEVPEPSNLAVRGPDKQHIVKTSPHLGGSRKRAGLVSTLSPRKVRKGGTRRATGQDKSSLTKGDTFWTRCGGCKFHFEYLRIYLNQKLRCPECKLGFLAVEVPEPSNLAALRPDKRQ